MKQNLTTSSIRISALTIAALLVSPAFAAVHLDWAGLGFIVPGLLANQFDRQGIWPTLGMLAVAVDVYSLALEVLAVQHITTLLVVLAVQVVAVEL